MHCCLDSFLNISSAGQRINSIRSFKHRARQLPVQDEFLVLLTALAGLGLVYAVKSCNKKYLTAAVAAMALFFNLALIPTVAVPLSGLRSGKQLALQLQNKYPEKAEIGLYGEYPTSAVFYSGGIMYLTLLFNFSKKIQYMLLLTGGIVASVTLLKFGGILTRQLLALIAATVFPVLSMTVIVELWESCKKNTPNTLKIIISATWQLALAVILSLIGASFVAAVLGDSRFFLEIDIYKGVKLTFILPVLLISLWYMQRFNVLSKGQIGNIAVHLKNFFSTRITVKHVAFLGVLAFVAYIFVGRSGHTAGVPVPALEIKMRLFLEQMMYARPREKEFMIGHPAFYLAAFAAYKQAPRLWQMLLVVGATIGQGSLVQTFAHMRTPVIMSYIRAVDGYALGAVLGIIAVIAVSILLPYVQKWQRRFLERCSCYGSF